MRSHFVSRTVAGILVAGALGFTAPVQGQKSSLSDAEVQSNVLRAMAGDRRLVSQQINASTSFGVVTLSGSVSDDSARDLAETVASHAAGVRKVVDQLAVGASAGVQSAEDQRAASVVPPPAVAESAGPPADQIQDEQEQQGAAAQITQPAYPNAQAQGQAPYDGQQAASAQPQQRRRIYRRDYERQMAQQQGQAPYAQSYGYGNQGAPGGVSVAVPAGTPVQVRLNRWLSSGRVQPGTNFEGTIASDVAAGGHIAIPRGAIVQGTVLDVSQPGSLTGSGSITLQLQTVNLGGRSYSLLSDPWTVNGRSKTGNTVGTTATLGILGALIGGAAGGGGGALAGAGIGSAAGLGVSAASGGGNAIIPGEARISFRLSQPTSVVTVSETEMMRLGANTGPESNYGDGRRSGYPPSYYDPGYYGPAIGVGVGVYPYRYRRPRYYGYGPY